jgi:lysophospholipase L1-like esterase
MPAALQRFIDKMNSLDKAVWVWCGDSITHGADYTRGLRDYVELVEERLRHELKRVQHLFVNTAISGDSTREILAQFDHRVTRFQPDFFTLMIGMNDCRRKPDFFMEISEYESNLKEIVRRVREKTPAEVLMQTSCAVHPELTQERSRYPEFMEVFRKVAAELDTAFIEHQAAWEKVRLSDPERFNRWMGNPYHPNGLGHWMFAEKILTELSLGPLKVSPKPKAG